MNKKSTILSVGAMLIALTLTAQTPQQDASSPSTGLTIPKSVYADSVDFSNAPKHKTDRFPLSDQNNESKWKKIKKACDEFEAKEVNTDRWYPNNPGWKGRQPTQFHESNVTLEDGYAVFRINQHGDEELLDGYTHSAGFLVSKDTFKYGYFEARLKLNNSPWVAGFWMSNHENNWWTEIDICENCPGAAKNINNLNSNVHVFMSPKDQGDVKKHFSIGKKHYVPFRLEEDFHVWGLEWDEDFIRFYIDGVLFREVENTHWHQPLRININNESNKWFDALPDDSKVNETYLVDYFRVWTK